MENPPSNETRRENNEYRHAHEGSLRGHQQPPASAHINPAQGEAMFPAGPCYQKTPTKKKKKGAKEYDWLSSSQRRKRMKWSDDQRNRRES